MSIVDKKYIDFYSKDPHAFRFPFKPIANDLNIAHAISMTVKLPFGLNRKSICVYNPFSLSNVIRRNEQHRIYLNEAEKVTAPTSELKEALFAFHKSLSRNNPLITANLHQRQNMYDMEYPNANKSVYGLMMFEFVFDVSQHNAKYYVELLARKADLLNYNYVDYSADSPHDIEFNGKTYTCARVWIQFEASYQDKVRLDLADYAYHVTTKKCRR